MRQCVKRYFTHLPNRQEQDREAVRDSGPPLLFGMGESCGREADPSTSLRFGRDDNIVSLRSE